MRIDKTGNVGIGTTAPVHNIDVVGTAGLSTGTAWTNTSDARLKNVLGPVPGALETVTRLRPVRFTWNDLWSKKFAGEDPGGIRYGFVAQEIQPFLPEFVTQDTDGYLWYNPSGFEAILTAAIQELKAEKDAEIEKLKAENEAWEMKYEALERRIEVLEGGR